MKRKRFAALMLAGLMLAGGCGSSGLNESLNELAEALDTEAVEKLVEEVLSSEAPETEAAVETEAPEPEDAVVEAAAPDEIPELMLSQESFYDTDDDESYTLLFTGNSGYLKLTPESAEKFPELAKSLEEDSLARKKKYDETHEASLEGAKTDRQNNPEMLEGMNYSANYVEHPQRVDNVVLSLTEDCDSFQGGAHGGYWSTGVTFDAQTGEKLLLTDVLKNTDNLTAILRSELLAAYDEDTFFDLDESLAAYDPTLGEEGAMETESGDFVYPYVWYLTNSGLEFYFAPYAIAPYAMGAQTVTLKYSDYAEFFEEKYLPSETNGFVHTFPYAISDQDLNGDGITDALAVSYEWEEGKENPTGITVAVNEYLEPEKCGGYQPKVTLKSDDLLSDTTFTNYYIVTEDGRQYLYTMAPTYNDWSVLCVFDLNDDTIKPVDSEWYRGGYLPDGEDFALLVPTVPSRIPFSSNFDFLQTFSAMRYYQPGPDGMPVSDETLYVNHFASPDNAMLELKTEIGCEILNEDDSVASEETLPVGTSFCAYRTDGEKILDVMLSDGRIARLPITNADYPCEIGGIVDEDLVEQCWYAG
ncbi:MAG: DUF3298 domain-containing protein [Lachnospiraceae bacterium]|nr:DUF3298 domain-containing protein [Lachnospiraceae bacterium]